MTQEHQQKTMLSQWMGICILESSRFETLQPNPIPLRKNVDMSRVEALSSVIIFNRIFTSYSMNFPKAALVEYAKQAKNVILFYSADDTKETRKQSWLLKWILIASIIF